MGILKKAFSFKQKTAKSDKPEKKRPVSPYEQAVVDGLVATKKVATKQTAREGQEQHGQAAATAADKAPCHQAQSQAEQQGAQGGQGEAALSASPSLLGQASGLNAKTAESDHGTAQDATTGAIGDAAEQIYIQENGHDAIQRKGVDGNKIVVAAKVAAQQPDAPLAQPDAPLAANLQQPAKKSWVERLKTGLSLSSTQLSDSIGAIFTKRKLDDDTLQDLEDVLLQADLGIKTAMGITDTLASGRYGKDVATLEVRTIMSEEIKKVLAPVAIPLELDLAKKPHVILVVGVNGTGKTTTIGKLAAKLTAGGVKVMLAAGDTFRAAAIEQLHIWGQRINVPVVSSQLGADAASLAYDAYSQAQEAGSDVLIIDTAGRLQNKAELMEELAKIVRVLGKHDPDAPHTVLQTLDATTGQNALSQVEVFKNIAGVNGLVMTKLDGTARGGILVAIAAQHKLPIHFIGVGEGVADLEPFAAADFAEAIAGKHQ